MKKFMALYMAPRSAIDEMMQATPEQAQAGMDAWMAWANDNKSMLVDLGMPLGRTMRTTAGGTSATSNEITGYSLVQAESLEAAAAAFAGHPHLMMSGASVDVLECIVLPGM